MHLSIKLLSYFFIQYKYNLSSYIIFSFIFLYNLLYYSVLIM